MDTNDTFQIAHCDPGTRSARYIYRTFFSIMCALTVVTCLKPSFTDMFSKLAYSEIIIHVTGKSAVGGSEVWIADTASYDLRSTLSDAENTIFGNFEFRTAADYGYAYDFLVSYGENVGSEIHIRYAPFGEPKMLFYKSQSTGEVSLNTNTGSQVLNLYSDTPGMMELPLAANRSCNALYDGSLILLFLVVFSICYLGTRKIRISSSVKSEKASRDPAMDLIRSLAAFFVVAVHSFLASGYYTMSLTMEWKAVFLTYIRWIFLLCNSMFVLLTGYFCRNRKLGKSAYTALIPLLLTFFVLTSMRILVMDVLVWKTSLSLRELLGHLVSMDLAWYLQMYLGLALLLPFLNISWRVLSLNGKGALICILVSLVALGGITGCILPSYWQALWPITYYFLGAFMAEYSVNIGRPKLLLAFLGIIGLETWYSLTYTANGVFCWSLFGGGGNGEYHGFTVIASSVLLFLILKEVKIKNNTIAKILESISTNSLGIYIVSVGITDNIVYPYFKENYPTPTDFMQIQFIPVFMSFCLAWIISAIISIPVTHLSRRIVSKINLSSQR